MDGTDSCTALMERRAVGWIRRFTCLQLSCAAYRGGAGLDGALHLRSRRLQMRQEQKGTG